MTAAISPDTPGFPNEAELDTITAWDGIAEMLNQPYWNRTWVYQEATTSGEIWFFCGEHSFNNIHLSATVYSAREFSQFPEFHRRFAEAAGQTSSAWALNHAQIDREKAKPSSRSLLRLMIDMKKTRCTDFRDKVFAPLGHATDGAQDFVIVDYNKKLGEVYADVVHYAVHTSRSLDILGSVFTRAPDATNSTLREVTDSALPSWVPDWRRRIAIPPFDVLSGPVSRKPLYKPSGDHGMEVSISGKAFNVHGLVLESIDYVAKIWDEAPETKFDVPRGWKDELVRQGLEITDDIIKRTLVADLRINRAEDESESDRTRGNALDWQMLGTLPSALSAPLRRQ